MFCIFNVCASMNASMSIPEKYINISSPWAPCSHETFIMWGPLVINELSTTSVVCELYGENTLTKTTVGLDTLILHLSLCDKMSHLSRKYIQNIPFFYGHSFSYQEKHTKYTLQQTQHVVARTNVGTSVLTSIFTPW